MSNLEFTTEFSQQRSRLLAFAYRLTRNAAEAEDLLQETALKAYHHKGSYKQGTNLRAWLMTIMRNTFINEYRKQRRRLELREGIRDAHWINRNSKAVRNHGENKLVIEEIQRELSHLEDWMKTPFLMYYQGYKYAEIAKHLKLPLGTVKSRIFFARKQLRSKLKTMYGPHPLEDLLQAS